MKFYEFNEDEKRVDIFNERFYPIMIDGTLEWFRNVTTILGIIDKGYGYDEWLRQVGYNSEIIVDRAGKFGSTFHGMIESFLKKESVKYHEYLHLGEVTATALWERFNTWVAFWAEFNNDHKIEYKQPETIVYSKKHKYAGTCDFPCKIDGDYSAIDWKSGKNVGSKEKQQMVAYLNALEEMTGRKYPYGYIVHVHPSVNKKGYRITKVENDEGEFELFLATKKVFDANNKDKPKVLTLPLEININDLNINKEK